MKNCLLMICLLAIMLPCHAYTLSGTVTGGSTTITNIKYVYAVPMTLDTFYLTFAIPFLNTYSLQNLDSGSYIIFAFQDMNMNFLPGLDEPRCFYGGGTIPQLFNLQDDSSGIVLALQTPNSGGFTGTISYAGSVSGRTYVIASRSADFSGLPNGIGIVIDSTGSGAYTAFVDSFGTYYAYAYKDANGNLLYDTDEPYGVYGGDAAVPIDVQPLNSPDNIDITLVDPPNSIGDNQLSAQRFSLGEAYPNPFNAETRIPLSLRTAATVELSIYNVLGCKVAQLADGYFAAGEHSFTFAASDFPSGLYFVELRTSGVSIAHKIILLK